jgi:multimeric flavodoxin WrbA
MKITAFSSTPRQRGNSDILTDHVLEAATQAGADVEKVRLTDYQMAPCTACNACQKTSDAPCIIDDDVAELLAKMTAADGIILASPVYFFTISAQLKILIDRSYALGGGGCWDALAGKRMGVILTYGDDDPVDSGVFNAIGTLRDTCRFLKIELTGIIHASCDGEGEISDNPRIIEEARELGRKLVQ